MRRLHQDDVRAKIQTSQLINRLSDHVFGKVELSASQVSAAMGLIKKTLPDLSSVEMTGRDGGPIESAVDVRGLSSDQLKALASVRLPTDR
jgi:hypothetical protein